MLIMTVLLFRISPVFLVIPPALLNPIHTLLKEILLLSDVGVFSQTFRALRKTEGRASC